VILLEHNPGILIYSDAVQDNNQQRLDIITATPRITFGAAFMSQVGGDPSIFCWEGHFERPVGFTPRKLDSREDFKLPKEFSIGLVSFYALLPWSDVITTKDWGQTNLSSRPTVEVRSQVSEIAPCTSHNCPTAKWTFEGGASLWCFNTFGQDREISSSNRVFRWPRHRGYSQV